MIAGAHTAHLLPKTKPKGRHPQKALSAAFVRSAPPGRHADGNGLYLFVQPSGTRSWIQRLLVRGRRRELGLGSLALVPLAEAREKALVNRKLARQGGDPLAEKRRSQGIPTFAEAAMRVLEQKRAGWRNPRHPREWMSSLRRLAFPRIGKMPVSEVTSADVLEILSPIWHRKAQTARRVRQRLRAVLEWAVAMEFRMDNPCDRIGPVLGPQQDVTEHMQALPHREVAAVIRRVRASAALPAARLAFEFLVLTAARWGEVRWAEWEEIDRDGRGREACGPSRPVGQRRTAGTGCRCVDVPWRFSRRRRHSGRKPVHWCSPMGAGSISMTASCAACCASLGLRPCRTV